MAASPQRAPHPVKGGCHAEIRFASDAPRDSSISVEHLATGKILARETIPLAAGNRSRRIKTHPDSTHVALHVASPCGWTPAVTVDCGDAIQAIARHFIVIGAMKAGTTTFFRMFGQHPEICRTAVEVPGKSFIKEINYFRYLYEPGHSPVHYDWRFPFDTQRHAWTFDVSTNYAKLPASRPVAERMAALGADIKIAYILREPVDRIESQIAHAMQKGIKTASETHCIRVSRYAAHLDNYLRHFSWDDILLLDFNELMDDPSAMQHRVCEFLGIRTIETAPGIHNRRTVKFRLSDSERERFADALRPDVARMVSDHGFDPAREWLRPASRSFISRIRRAIS